MPAPKCPASPELECAGPKPNGLTGDNIKPWHLKATFTLFDENGKTTDQETYEESWASPTKYKIAYTGTGFSQTNYGTDQGVMRSGSRHFAPYLFVQIGNQLIDPFLDSERLTEHLSFTQEKLSLGKTKLHCITVQGSTLPSAPPITISPKYCFDLDLPVLRVSSRWDGFQFARSDIFPFQNRFLARDIQGFRGGKILIKAHLDTVETLNATSDADFAPPDDALPVIPKITISSAEASRTLQLSKLLRYTHPLRSRLTWKARSSLKLTSGWTGMFSLRAR